MVGRDRGPRPEAREEHLRPAAEPGEVVERGRADGEHGVRCEQRRVDVDLGSRRRAPRRSGRLLGAEGEPARAACPGADPLLGRVQRCGGVAARGDRQRDVAGPDPRPGEGGAERVERGRERERAGAVGNDEQDSPAGPRARAGDELAGALPQLGVPATTGRVGRVGDGDERGQADGEIGRNGGLPAPEAK